jgi:hypothetical protein
MEARIRDMINNDQYDEEEDEDDIPEPVHATPNKWSHIMGKLDAKGPCKKTLAKKKKEVKPSVPKPWMTFFNVPEGCFDGYKHGYFKRVGDSKLYYRTPSNEVFEATGVDNFGPFRDPPMYNKRF